MTTNPGRPSGRLPRAQARYAAGPGAAGRTGGQTLGPLLRELRLGRGLSVRRLAQRAVVAPSTIGRLEAGQIRPRPSTLARIANGIDPDRRDGIRAELIAAAGDGLAADTGGWARYQERRGQAALDAGLLPLPLAWDRRLRLFLAGGAMWATAMALTDMAAALLDVQGARFDELDRLGTALRDEADRLQEEAGTVFCGHARPLRRWRGDPPDASLEPPPLSDLRAVWRWLWAWQVREGRLRPRSARERAIAATGERERQAIADAPEPPPAKRAEDVWRATPRRIAQHGPGEPLAARAEGEGRISHLSQ